jgi:hypothetical protein
MTHMNYYSLNYFKNKSRSENFSQSGIRSFSSQKSDGGYDIFLSHSFQDQSVVEGIYQEFVEFGFTVYVDWIVDKEILDREEVNVKTAEKLRERMDASRSLIFAFTENYRASYWAQWELGYMDAKKGRCALFPIQEDSDTDFSSQEYFALYPQIKYSNLILPALDRYKKELYMIQPDSVSNTDKVRLENWIKNNQ